MHDCLDCDEICDCNEPSRMSCVGCDYCRSIEGDDDDDDIDL